MFSPDGYIYPCTEAAGHSQLAIGRFIPQFDLFEEKFSQWRNRTILNIKKCRNCSIAPLCGGGCSFAAYSINGSVSDAYCHDSLKLVKDYLKTHKFTLLKKAQSKTA